MSSHAKRTFLACSLIVAVATLTSCSNKVEEETSDLRRDKAAGRYQTAYNRAEQIIASKSEYSPESVAYAESVIKETKTILTAHYGGNIRAQVASGNIDTALGMWSEIREKDPELVADDFDLARRMMRVYARQSLWDRATEVAKTFAAAPPTKWTARMLRSSCRIWPTFANPSPARTRCSSKFPISKTSWKSTSLAGYFAALPTPRKCRMRIVNCSNRSNKPSWISRQTSLSCSRSRIRCRRRSSPRSLWTTQSPEHPRQ
jgi:hypothetical protein